MSQTKKVTIKIGKCRYCNTQPEVTIKPAEMNRHRILLSCDCTATAGTFTTPEEITALAENWNTNYAGRTL